MTNGLSRRQALEVIQGSCGEGWLPLVNEVFDNLPPQLSITDAFQKWGALRFDTDPQGDMEFADYLENVAERSSKICEICGAVGIEMVIDNWVVTRCDAHSAGYDWRSDHDESVE